MTTARAREQAAIVEAAKANRERDLAKARERQRKNELAAHIQTVTKAPYMSGDRMESAARVEVAHAAFEREFFREFGITEPDKLRDDTLVQVLVTALRRQARAYANWRIAEAAEAQRISSLRSEFYEDNNQRYAALADALSEAVKGIGKQVWDTYVQGAKAAVAKTG